MGRFKQFSAQQKSEKYEWISFEVEDYVVHILFETSEDYILTEARHHGISLGGQYSAQLHKAHSSVGQQHIHVYAKNNQIFSMNLDGSAHDQSHGTRIPNKVVKAIDQKFPNFTLPEDNLIESAPESIEKLFIEKVLLS